MKICVTGFFQRDNWGDDMFEYVYRQALVDHDCKFISVDDLKVTDPAENFDLVLLGGGDVMIWYFTKQLSAYIQKTNIPIVALSVGFPYPTSIHEGMFDEFSLIGCRFKKDLDVLRSRFKSGCIFTPDIGFTLPHILRNNVTTIDTEKNKDVYRVGVCLSRPIYKNNKNYDKVVQRIATFLDHVTKKVPAGKRRCQLILIPFNVHTQNENEDDKLINKDVLSYMANAELVENIVTRKTVPEMYDLFKTLDLVICMRFHAHVLAMACNVPFLSMTHTSKVQKLLEDNNIHTLVPFERDDYNVVSDIDVDVLINYYNVLTQASASLRIEIQQHDYGTSEEIYIDFENLLSNLTSKKDYTVLKEHMNKHDVIEETVQSMISCTNDFKGVEKDIKIQADLLKTGELQFSDLMRDLKIDEKEKIVHIALEHLTGIGISPYYHGMISKIQNTNYDPYKELRWVWNDHIMSISDHKVVISTVQNILHILQEEFAEGNNIGDNFPDLLNGRSTLYELVKELDVTKVNFLSNLIASVVCNDICGHPFASYHYGLSQKLLTPDFNIYIELRWLLNDSKKRMCKQKRYKIIEETTETAALYNCWRPTVDSYDNSHNSGWMKILKRLYRNHSASATLIFDDYLDRTFVWGNAFYSHEKIIPYKQTWCGFIHHTANTEFSKHNIVTMFENPHFVNSLPFCKGLFTFSTDLGKKVKQMLKELGFDTIQVHRFFHPSEDKITFFEMDTYEANEERKIVKIGSWLRDAFAIYELNPCGKSIGNRKMLSVTKCQLGTNGSDNYHKPKELQLLMKSEHSPNEWDVSEYYFEGNPILRHQNQFIKDSITHMKRLYESVENIPHINDVQYDKLLSNNIVFVWLHPPVSAVNTVIECIMRNTPLLINRSTAVEEYLGKDYPFFCDSIAEANIKATDYDSIKQTHEYLKRMNKTRFTIDFFMNQFTNVIKTLK